MEKQDGAFRQGLGNTYPVPIQSVTDDNAFHYRLSGRLEFLVQGGKLFAYLGNGFIGVRDARSESG